MFNLDLKTIFKNYNEGFDNNKLLSNLKEKISQDYKTDLRIKNDAYKALQAASEDYLIELFKKANKCAIHENRETIQPKDLQLSRELGSI